MRLLSPSIIALLFHCLIVTILIINVRTSIAGAFAEDREIIQLWNVDQVGNVMLYRNTSYSTTCGSIFRSFHFQNFENFGNS